MGAESFEVIARGKTAKEAFKLAVEEAAYDFGHSGYTGTIAEKSDFVLIDLPDEYKSRPEAYADKLIDDEDPRIDDKWGPAGCIKLGNDKWLFFGWASS